MGKNGQEWARMGKNRQKWAKTGTNGQNGQKLPKMCKQMTKVAENAEQCQHNCIYVLKLIKWENIWGKWLKMQKNAQNVWNLLIFLKWEIIGKRGLKRTKNGQKRKKRLETGKKMENLKNNNFIVFVCLK